MRNKMIYFALTVLCLTSCNSNNTERAEEQNLTKSTVDSIKFKSDYSEVNGIKMYYEIHGTGVPLVLIHGGGSTIGTSFGRIIPLLSKKYSVIAVELQNHGHSDFREIPQTFEQDADDVAALMKNIGITKASFLGFSNGGTTATQIAIRHPEVVDKLILASAAFKRDQLFPGFFDMMQKASLDNMPRELKEAFLKINPDSARLQAMFEKDRDRMINFEDISDEQIKSVKALTLLIFGNADVVSPEHAVEMYRLIPNAHLAILPGGHGDYIGEITTLSKTGKQKEFVVAMIEEFLDKPKDSEL
ncbi:MAG TPA: alpha/beta hydrolase [Cytophagales bacterium]|nr:alpha/beta hydrolase [Cytophagales bacterium]